MPQTMQAPGWYDDEYYISQKVLECNLIKLTPEGQAFAAWTPASVRAFIAKVYGESEYAPWMGYDNFTHSGNFENASPNPLFNVMEYCAAKAGSLNAMNGGAGFGGSNSWTAASVLKFFNDNNISAWDHFTSNGQFEGLNPSNAMDLSAFLVNKAQQCNQMNLGGRNDWTPDSVLAYYRANGLNAVEVAGNANDPNVVAVREGATVNPPQGLTPWGATAQPVTYYLSTNQDVIQTTDTPLNFVATVGAQGSTLNANDQITGNSPFDSLTANIATDFSGLNRQGFVKNVPTINVNNITRADEELVFNAAEITGVSTWNVDGNVDLENVMQTGLTINYKNVDLSEYHLGFTKEATRGDNDSLTIGVDNVYYVERFNSSGIEHFTVNATGEESYIRCFIQDMETLTITGDAKLGIRGASADLKSVDATTATGAVALCTRMADSLESFRGGSGNNSVSMQSMIADCLIDGGEGNDTITLVNTTGDFNYRMTSIETLAIRVSKNLGDWMPADDIKFATNALSLDGSHTTGLENIALKGGNGWNFLDTTKGHVEARDITLSNYDFDHLNVNVTTLNNVNLAIDTVRDVTIKVGDDKADTADVLLGSVILPDAKAVAIDIAEIREASGAQTFVFEADLDAAQAATLSLTSGRYAPMKITGGDLSNVSELAFAGRSNVRIDADAQLAQDVKAVTADASGFSTGTIFASFVDNKAGGAELTFKGAENGRFNITVDATYSEINVEGGNLQDVLTIDATGATAENRIVVTGELGSEDDVIVIGSLANVDFTGLKNFDVNDVEVRATGTAQIMDDAMPVA